MNNQNNESPWNISGKRLGVESQQPIRDNQQRSSSVDQSASTAETQRVPIGYGQTDLSPQFLHVSKDTVQQSDIPYEDTSRRKSSAYELYGVKSGPRKPKSAIAQPPTFRKSISPDQGIDFFGDSLTTEPHGKTRSTLDQSKLKRGSITTMYHAGCNRPKASLGTRESRDAAQQDVLESRKSTEEPKSALRIHDIDQKPSTTDQAEADQKPSTKDQEEVKPTDTTKRSSLAGIAAAAASGVAAAAGGAAAALFGTGQNKTQEKETEDETSSDANQKMPSAWPETPKKELAQSSWQQDPTRDIDSANEPAIQGQEPNYSAKDNVRDEICQDENHEFCQHLKEPAIHGQNPQYYCGNEAKTPEYYSFQTAGLTKQESLDADRALDSPEVTNEIGLGDALGPAAGVAAATLLAGASVSTGAAAGVAAAGVSAWRNYSKRHSRDNDDGTLTPTTFEPETNVRQAIDNKTITGNTFMWDGEDALDSDQPTQSYPENDSGINDSKGIDSKAITENDLDPTHNQETAVDDAHAGSSAARLGTSAILGAGLGAGVASAYDSRPRNAGADPTSSSGINEDGINEDGIMYGYNRKSINPHAFINSAPLNQERNHDTSIDTESAISNPNNERDTSNNEMLGSTLGANDNDTGFVPATSAPISADDAAVDNVADKDGPSDSYDYRLGDRDNDHDTDSPSHGHYGGHLASAAAAGAAAGGGATAAYNYLNKDKDSSIGKDNMDSKRYTDDIETESQPIVQQDTSNNEMLGSTLGADDNDTSFVPATSAPISADDAAIENISERYVPSETQQPLTPEVNDTSFDNKYSQSLGLPLREQSMSDNNDLDSSLGDNLGRSAMTPIEDMDKSILSPSADDNQIGENDLYDDQFDQEKTPLLGRSLSGSKTFGSPKINDDAQNFDRDAPDSSRGVSTGQVAGIGAAGAAGATAAAYKLFDKKEDHSSDPSRNQLDSKDTALSKDDDLTASLPITEDDISNNEMLGSTLGGSSGAGGIEDESGFVPETSTPISADDAAAADNIVPEDLSNELGDNQVGDGQFGSNDQFDTYKHVDNTAIPGSTIDENDVEGSNQDISNSFGNRASDYLAGAGAIASGGAAVAGYNHFNKDENNDVRKAVEGLRSVDKDASNSDILGSTLDGTDDDTGFAQATSGPISANNTADATNEDIAERDVFSSANEHQPRVRSALVSEQPIKDQEVSNNEMLGSTLGADDNDTGFVPATSAPISADDAAVDNVADKDGPSDSYDYRLGDRDNDHDTDSPSHGHYGGHLASAAAAGAAAGGGATAAYNYLNKDKDNSFDKENDFDKNIKAGIIDDTFSNDRSADDQLNNNYHADDTEAVNQPITDRDASNNEMLGSTLGADDNDTGFVPATSAPISADDAATGNEYRSGSTMDDGSHDVRDDDNLPLAPAVGAGFASAGLGALGASAIKNRKANLPSDDLNLDQRGGSITKHDYSTRIESVGDDAYADTDLPNPVSRPGIDNFPSKSMTGHNENTSGLPSEDNNHTDSNQKAKEVGASLGATVAGAAGVAGAATAGYAAFQHHASKDKPIADASDFGAGKGISNETDQRNVTHDALTNESLDKNSANAPSGGVANQPIDSNPLISHGKDPQQRDQLLPNPEENKARDVGAAAGLGAAGAATTAGIVSSQAKTKEPYNVNAANVKRGIDQDPLLSRNNAKNQFNTDTSYVDRAAHPTNAAATATAVAPNSNPGHQHDNNLVSSDKTADHQQPLTKMIKSNSKDVSDKDYTATKDTVSKDQSLKKQSSKDHSFMDRFTKDRHHKNEETEFPENLAPEDGAALPLESDNAAHSGISDSGKGSGSPVNMRRVSMKEKGVLGSGIASLLGLNKASKKSNIAEHDLHGLDNPNVSGPVLNKSGEHPAGFRRLSQSDSISKRRKSSTPIVPLKSDAKKPVHKSAQPIGNQPAQISDKPTGAQPNVISNESFSSTRAIAGENVASSEKTFPTGAAAIASGGAAVGGHKSPYNNNFKHVHDSADPLYKQQHYHQRPEYDETTGKRQSFTQGLKSVFRRKSHPSDEDHVDMERRLSDAEAFKKETLQHQQPEPSAVQPNTGLSQPSGNLHTHANSGVAIQTLTSNTSQPSVMDRSHPIAGHAVDSQKPVAATTLPSAGINGHRLSGTQPGGGINSHHLGGIHSHGIQGSNMQPRQHFAHIPNVNQPKTNSTPMNGNDQDDGPLMRNIPGPNTSHEVPTKSSYRTGQMERRRGSIQRTIGKIFHNSIMQDKGTLAEISGQAKINAYNSVHSNP